MTESFSKERSALPTFATKSGFTPHDLRDHNLALVLRYILLGQGKWSRADVAAHTGITRATVSRLVDELIHAGLVNEREPYVSSRRGRPATRLVPAAYTHYAIGIEVNPYCLVGYAVDLTGEILARDYVYQNSIVKSPAEIMRCLSRMAHGLKTQVEARESRFIGLGISVPGVLIEDSKVTSIILGWDEVDYEKILKEVHDLGPVLAGNDGAMAAYALAYPFPGVPAGPESLIYFSGNEGISGGIVIDHEIFDGQHGRASELGHLCGALEGPTCKCGSIGCLESRLGMDALLSEAQLPPDSQLKEILSSAATGSEPAKQTLEHAGRILGVFLAGIANMMDISDTVIAGHLTEIWEGIAPFVHQELVQRLLYIKPAEFKIEISEDTHGMAARGIAHRVLRELISNPARWIDDPELSFEAVVEWIYS
ncbi:hypothetical protein BM477_05020 [Boudabousia marimammalium]|uniref:HTH iclR-type domain-containing protein n=1 Tax=Boudabousia marimammalium TaxID=156892 RepID=A0A1Q5PPE6_9ACTO|nr:hypothetical protein BM477_05020 [Boudabousia marimammalium]